MRLAAAALLALAALPASAQLVPPGGTSQSCPIAVAFEPLLVRSVVGVSNQYHAVVVIGGDAYEGNPTGRFPNWGSLAGRRRDLRAKPLLDGTVQRFAGQRPQGCAAVLAQAARITAEVNAARLPYGPAPELQWNTVNSNSYAWYLIAKLGLDPPAPPWPPAYGFVPGYNPGIRD